MPKKTRSRIQKKHTKSPRSRNTKKLSAFAPTFKLPPGSELAIVDGDSMHPVLQAGDTVAYLPVAYADLSLGDIIVFQMPSQHGYRDLRVHRLVLRYRGWLLESGDNTKTAALVKPAQILGRVVAYRRRQKWKPLGIYIPRAHQLFQGVLALGFLELNEQKNRLLGAKPSPALWRASKVYREILSTLGLNTPLLWPK